MKCTNCKLCGATFVCDNGMWFTTCTCAKDRPTELAAAQNLTPEQAHEVDVAAIASPGPQTHEETRQFHEGFLSGATAYAVAVGHSSLKSDNPKLCEVFDAQGWRTIEMFEKWAIVPAVCEAGIKG